MDSRPVAPTQSVTGAGNTQRIPQTSLRPFPVSMSAHQCAVPLSTLPPIFWKVCTLSYCEGTDPLYFKAAILQETSTSLVSEFWYRNWIEGKIINGSIRPKLPLEAAGIADCEFSLTSSRGTAQSLMMPIFHSTGCVRIPFTISGRTCEQLCFIVPNKFHHETLEMDHGMILGADFLRANNASVAPMLSFAAAAAAAPVLDELVIHTSACRPNQLRWGFGIYFPALKGTRRSEISGPIPSHHICTDRNTRLYAMVRALELVKSFNIACRNIKILSDSSQIIKLVLQWVLPSAAAEEVDLVDQESIDYRCLLSLKEEVESLRAKGKVLIFSYVNTNENHIADDLAYKGALAINELVGGEGSC